MNSAVKCFSHCALPFQVFGLQYFSVKTLSTENESTMPSLAYTIYFFLAFIVLTGQMAIFGYFAMSDVDETLSAKTVVNYFVQHSMYIGLFIIIWVSLIQAYASTPLTKKFFLNSVQISKMCAKDFDFLVDHEQIRRKVLKLFLLFIVFFFTFQCLMCWYEIGFEQSSVFVRTFSSILPLVFLNVAGFKFIFLVKSINFYLEAVADITLKVLKPFMTIGENFDFFMVVKTKKPSSELSKKIKNLRQIYNVINENAEIANRSMGATVLTVFTVMVTVITASGYRIFLAIVGKLPMAKVGGG